MYHVGEYVIKASQGVCRIEDILPLNLPYGKKDRLYYLLIPREDAKAKIYVPVDSEHSDLRKAMDEKEAWDIIEKLPDMQEDWIANDKQREQRYKEVIKGGRPEELACMIKNLYQHKKKRNALGKRNGTVDEHLFQVATDHLFSEMAFVIGKDKGEIHHLIEENARKKQATKKAQTASEA